MVITVCDGVSAERCPVFPGNGKKIAWYFEDPSSMNGTLEEILAHTRRVRDQIEESIKDFIRESKMLNFWT